ncbi:MAG: SUMF1/EgtB/PvdO family nonheme iron enzyme [Chloroflexi bacterium]|nr:SUMF1/EgtB/PvdO family nonheme iron enzyme [Chloroflexota bacterium]
MVLLTEKLCRRALEGCEYLWGDNKDPVCSAGAENGAQIIDCEGGTAPVKTFAPNRYGLYDMTGNVWGWVEDWYSSDYYSQSLRERSRLRERLFWFPMCQQC